MSWRTRCNPPRPKPSTSRKESDATKKLYGMDEPETKVYGANCLHGPAIGGARRALRRGL